MPAGDTALIASPQSRYRNFGDDNAINIAQPSILGSAEAVRQSTYLSMVPVETSGQLRQPQDVTTSPPGPLMRTTSRALELRSILNPVSDPSLETSKPLQTTGHGLGLSQKFFSSPTASQSHRKHDELRSTSRVLQAKPFYSLDRDSITSESSAVRAWSLESKGNATCHEAGPPTQSLAEPVRRTHTVGPGIADIASLTSISSATRSTYPSIEIRKISPQALRFQPYSFDSPPCLSDVVPPQGDSSSTPSTSTNRSEQSSAANYYGFSVSDQKQGTYSSARASGHVFLQDGGGRGSSDPYLTRQPVFQQRLGKEQGLMVEPVEPGLQQASTIADEGKRKRNAGASARFRVRRKEKENRASQTISDLRYELRLMQEEQDFYRSERNRLQQHALTQSQVPRRPVSTRLQSRPAPPTTQARGISAEHDESERMRSG